MTADDMPKECLKETKIDADDKEEKKAKTFPDVCKTCGDVVMMEKEEKEDCVSGTCSSFIDLLQPCLPCPVSIFGPLMKASKP